MKSVRHTFALAGLLAIVSLLAANPLKAETVASVDMDLDQQLTEEILPPPYSGPRIRINVPARELHVIENDRIVRTYPIAVGSAAYRTPLGPREMTQIVWNPWWFPPKDSAWAKDAVDTPPGPRNPLGPVKMKLGDAIMIHGTSKPQSVGRAASHGCMRMLNENAKELARYIQERVMGQTDPAVYNTYAQNPRRSYYVNLTQTVPIDIIYNYAEIDNGQLRVFQDVYYKVRDKVAFVRDLLAANGMNPLDYDLAFLEQTLKSARNQDVRMPLADLLIANRAKAVQTAAVMQQ